MQYQGQLAQTIAEQQQLSVAARFQHAREGRQRRMLRQSDAFVELVEEYRLREVDMVPMWVWDDISRFMWKAAPQYVAELGQKRDLNHVTEVLLHFQGTLMRRAVVELAERSHPAAAIVHFPMQYTGEATESGDSS